ncbi:MAG TPA: helix-turn-helix transcriptional regulator [Pantanalinema sp.]
MADLGARLKELREARGLSQRAAAQKLGISHTALRSYEVGRTPDGAYVAIPKRELLIRMAELYQFPAHTLLAIAGRPVDLIGPQPVPSGVEAEAQEVAEVYRRLPEDHRRMLLKVVRAYKDEIPEADTPPPNATDK